MNEEITYAERQELRERLLEAARGLKAMKGAATLESLGTITERVFDEMFGLADELRGRIEMLEETQLRYEGVFDKESQYDRNALCTHRGGLWHCQESTRDAPGTSKAWRLTSKTFVARGAQKA